jgi:hypothetical protein
MQQADFLIPFCRSLVTTGRRRRRLGLWPLLTTRKVNARPHSSNSRPDTAACKAEATRLAAAWVDSSSQFWSTHHREKSEHE